MPAVAQLADAGLVPPGFTVLGSANTDWSTGDFRQHIAGELDKHAPGLFRCRLALAGWWRSWGVVRPTGIGGRLA
jgi:hypothetical protein